MDTQEIMLEEAFYDLLQCYSVEQACVFLQGCYFVSENDQLNAFSFSRLVFSEGDPSEVYTKNERDFIDRWSTEVGCFTRQRITKEKRVNCRYITAFLDDTSDPTLQALKFMKIAAKALSGFSVFFFVLSDGIQFGCIQTNLSQEGECLLTPVMHADIDWSEFHYTFLYRDESEDYSEFYRGMITALTSLPECAVREEQVNMTQYYYLCRYSDDDPADEIARAIVQDGVVSSLRDNPNDDNRDKRFEIFERDVMACLPLLDYIKTNQINTVELLIDAEEANKQHKMEKSSENKNPNERATDFDFIALDLIDDPIKLVEKLKKERGLK